MYKKFIILITVLICVSGSSVVTNQEKRLKQDNVWVGPWALWSYGFITGGVVTLGANVKGYPCITSFSNILSNAYLV